nr:RHS repeat-associated core domain-containing protein [Ramlibacter albus]
MSRTKPGITFNLGMPGQYCDEESRLCQNWNREYSPWDGRYTQFDPMGLHDGPNGYIYVHGDPLRGTDPMGLANSAATFWMRGKEPPNKPPEETMCKPDQCFDPIDLKAGNGMCEPGDIMCAIAMQAAGLQEPYFYEKKRYSRLCLVSLGLFGKVGGVKAGNSVAGQVAASAEAAGATATGLNATLLNGAANAAKFWKHPAFTAAMAPLAIKELLDTCACEGK